MKPDIKERLITALESGEYKKGRRVLKLTDPDGNFCLCALGVLCDLYKKETGKGDFVNLPSASKGWMYAGRFVVEADDERSSVGPEVTEWAGLTPDDLHYMIVANDDIRGPTTFASVLDYLRQA